MTHVLIVDDEPLIRWSVAESLEAAGHHTSQAGSAREALRFFEGPVDGTRVVILDLRLPDSSDLGLLRRIRSIAPDCRVLLMTAHGTPEVMDEALRAGASAVLSKPFDLAQVVRLVNEFSCTDSGPRPRPV
jgi:two-component system nitrogen regulation response regulator GlnG